MRGTIPQPALSPVIETMRADAQREAAALLGSAEADARRTTESAAAEASAILAQARADGVAAAEQSARTALAATRREARETILAARLRAYDAVRTSALDELRRRRSTPEVAALVDRLSAEARSRLGPNADVRPLDGDGIGVVAQEGERRVVVTAETLVDRALAALGERIEQLWA